MNITKIRLGGRTNIDFITFGMTSATNWILKEVSGLGPPDIEVSVEYGKYLGRTPIAREIVMRVGMKPNYSQGKTPGAMRDTLYGLLTPRSNDAILVQMMNGNKVVGQSWGYVKKIEIVPFTKDPEVQITIQCRGPYLQAEEEITKVPVMYNDLVIDNVGSVTTGFFLRMRYDSPHDYFMMRDEAGAGGPRIRINYDFEEDDVLQLRTSLNGRSIYVIRGENTFNIIRALTPDSTWFGLYPGDNHFWIEPIAATEWLEFTYLPLYWGI